LCFRCSNGADPVGIVAKVSAVLAAANVNVIDISQTTVRECFAMIRGGKSCSQGHRVRRSGPKAKSKGAQKKDTETPNPHSVERARGAHQYQQTKL
jgi:hypothetical protein